MENRGYRARGRLTGDVERGFGRIAGQVRDRREHFSIRRCLIKRKVETKKPHLEEKGR